MSLSDGNLDAGVNIHETLFKPLGGSEDDRFSCTRSCIYFATHESDIDLRAGVSGNEFWLLEAKVVREEPADDVNRVPHGLGSDPHTGRRAVSYTHLRAHETPEHLVCRLLLE